jgi:Arc/MetJ-type ribon-helix-helix transcriptional regulator
MQPVQVRLTKELLRKLDELVERGLYPNRSEAIRDGVRRLANSFRALAEPKRKAALRLEG